MSSCIHHGQPCLPTSHAGFSQHDALRVPESHIKCLISKRPCRGEFFCLKLKFPEFLHWKVAESPPSRGGGGIAESLDTHHITFVYIYFFNSAFLTNSWFALVQGI